MTIKVLHVPFLIIPFYTIFFLLFICLQEHYNFSATDEKLGPILLSAKAETVAGHEHWRLILRLRTGTSHELVPVSCLNLSSGSTPVMLSSSTASSNPSSNVNGNSVTTPCPARMAKVRNTIRSYIDFPG